MWLRNMAIPSNRKKYLVRMLVLTLVLTVLTIHLVFHFSALAASTEFNRNFCRSIIAQIHVMSVEYGVDSDAVSNGYFVANLTFENPTNEQVTLTRGTHAEYYYYNSSTGGGWQIAEGWTYDSVEISSGISKMVLRMDLNPYSRQDPSFAIVTNYEWIISYHPKLGTVSYQMTAIVTDSSIQHEGPTFPKDEIYTVADTYAASIVIIWILGFEIVAVSLIRRGGAQKSGALVEGEKHNVMLSIIYGVQGLGIIAAQIYYTFIYVLIPPPPLPSGPGGYIPVAASFAAAYLFLEINSIALAFLSVAAGLFLKLKWARKAAFPMSLISVLVLVLGVVITLNSLANQGMLLTHNIVLSILFSAIAVAHGIVMYVVAFKKPKFST
jgi:hypothetical protein